MKRLIAILTLLASPGLAQVCDQSFTLRNTNCPAGATDCTKKSSSLTWQELDANFVNAIDVCNALDVTGTDIDVEGDWAFLGDLAIPTGTAFPGSPTTNDVFIITDDSTAGACDSAAGSALSLCYYNGASWEKLGDGGGSGASAGATGNVQYSSDGAGGFGAEAAFSYDTTTNTLSVKSSNVSTNQITGIDNDSANNIWRLRQTSGGDGSIATLSGTDGSVLSILFEDRIGADACLQLGDAETAANAACVCVSSDQLYHDTNCNSAKDGGEEFIDFQPSSGYSTDHGAGTIVEADLDEDSGTPTDEDVLTYDSTGANFNWVAQSTLAAGTATTASNLAADGLDDMGEIAATIKRGPDATDTHILTTDESAPGSAQCLEMDTDGSVILAGAACGSGGGDSIEIEDGDDGGTFTAIDTTARFEDQGDINFTFADGGAGGPDTVTATVRADSVALGTDTTNNYVATVADAGNSTITVTGSGSESAAVTLDAVDVNCTGCLGSTEVAALDTADVTTGTWADARVAESNVTQHEAAIDHDALTNFVAAEHYPQRSSADCSSESGGITNETCWDTAGNSWYVCESGPCNGSGWVVATAAGDGVGYDTVKDNDVAETQRAILNILSGTNISATCADDAGNTETDCTFAIDLSATTNNAVLYDDGTDLNSVTQITHDGTNVTIDLVSEDEAESTLSVMEVWNDSGATIHQCAAVYISGSNAGPPVRPTIAVADADTAAEMPAIGLVQANISNGAAGFVVVGGRLKSIDTSVTEVWAENAALYVENDNTTTASADCGETLTETRPTGASDLVQAVARVVRVNASLGEVVVMGAGRSNDVPNAITIGTNDTINTDSVTLDNTWSTAQLESGVVLDSESPAAGDVSGDFATGLSVDSVQAGAVTDAGVDNNITIDHSSAGTLTLDADDPTTNEARLAWNSTSNVLMIGEASGTDYAAQGNSSGQAIGVADGTVDLGGTGGTGDTTGDLDPDRISGDTTDNNILDVAAGGTGAVSLTDGGIVLGSGTGAVTVLSQATNGQIPIGSTGSDPSLGTITPVANETDVTNGAGSITIGIVTSPTLDGTNFSGIPSSALTTEVRSMYWNAYGMEADGAQCKDPSGSSNTVIQTPTIAMTDNDGCIVWGSVVMPDSWNAGTVTFEWIVEQIAASTDTIEMDFAAKCISHDEAISAFGAPPTGERAASITLTADNDTLHATTIAVTVDGTTCAGGDLLYWTGQVDAAASGGGIATAAEMVGVKMEYTSNIGD